MVLREVSKGVRKMLDRGFGTRGIVVSSDSRRLAAEVSTQLQIEDQVQQQVARTIFVVGATRGWMPTHSASDQVLAETSRIKTWVEWFLLQKAEGIVRTSAEPNRVSSYFVE